MLLLVGYRVLWSGMCWPASCWWHTFLLWYPPPLRNCLDCIDVVWVDDNPLHVSKQYSAKKTLLHTVTAQAQQQGAHPVLIVSHQARLCCCCFSTAGSVVTVASQTISKGFRMRFQGLNKQHNGVANAELAEWQDGDLAWALRQITG
jgi:mRNA-degrading endonuclease toxin of MazEF toxin-antitoxin module